MKAFKAISIAILKGFMRDKASVFFAIIFPLMFLVLFGGIFNNTERSPIETRSVGEIGLIEGMPKEARAAFEESFDVDEISVGERDSALDEVRKGDLDLVLEQRGDTLVAHYTQTDQVQAATIRGILQSFVDGTNVAVTGQQPKFTLRAESVEDDSMQMIDLVTPGLLGWAIAMSAAFGAAATLNGWRTTKLLRRIQLSPVPTGTVVGARIVATMLIAMVQTAIFLGLGTLGFGLNLTGSWWMAVPLVMCGTLCFMALGLLSGAVAKTTEGAVNMANFLVLPMAFLSGSFFPLDNAPSWLQVLSKALPLRHLNDGMLDVMVRGEGPSAALLPMAILLAFAAVITAIAAKLFRWDTV